MTQVDLIFDPTGESIRERHRHGPVGEAVRAFFVSLLTLAGKHGQPKFKAGHLYTHVIQHHHVAPDTPNRIMRLMKESGELDYDVVNRARSLYRVLGVRLESGEVLGQIRP